MYVCSSTSVALGNVFEEQIIPLVKNVTMLFVRYSLFALTMYEQVITSLYLIVLCGECLTSLLLMLPLFSLA